MLSRRELRTVDGGRVVEVTLSAPVPVLGLWGAGTMSVTAHAIAEAGDD